MEYRPPPRSASRAGQGRPTPARTSTTERPAQPRITGRPHHSAPTERIADKAAAPVRRPRPQTRRPAAKAKPKQKMVGGKVFLALLSVLVLFATGYYSQLVDDFADGLNTGDFTEDTGEKPADGAVDILMVGMDSRTDAQGNPLSKEQLAMLNAGKAEGVINTDTLIMIRIPNDGGKAVGVSIPRDSYVDIPGFGKHKINSAYAREKLDSLERLRKSGVQGRDLEVQSNVEGGKKLIATVEKLTGAKIDHYAEVNLLGFYDITNAIGGIDVCLNKAVKDPYSGANFPAGQQNLSGAPALAFVRQRHGLANGDIDRITRQQTFMNGMAKKILSKDLLVPGSESLGKLQEAIKKSVVLDKNWDVMRFAQQMMGFTGGNLSFQTIPHGRIDLETPSDGSAIQVDPTDVRKFVGGILTGGAQPSSGASSSGQSEPTQAAKPTVTVLNGSGRTGLAAEVADSLTGQGFKTGETGNAAARAKTVIRYARGDKPAGEAVAGALDGTFLIEEDANLGKGKVTVLIGKDFPQAGQRLTGDPMVRLNGLAQPSQVACVN
ncbi:Cell envelope-associated transcriptional attenuator LytR-CpsA-Psr, subfamily A1 (as in PMID19099556) [Alloactinosynnema sp. L-07]|uniref:LCP family protein n=1 Tax=Alloactinosynnema sp. L-07 TaxID=1653480 RepID=UPI00065F08BA|nr:LCP family protein [Alloactinosynnema sp. L-07]CRK62206.1 Cell envelope-associated transcriptional attenuator LytR-CpsA-Psr, subfamily A1 (as in PMID19099556) [Alloactinosynnema sp. L-07]